MNPSTVKTGRVFKSFGIIRAEGMIRIPVPEFEDTVFCSLGRFPVSEIYLLASSERMLSIPENQSHHQLAAVYITVSALTVVCCY